MFLPFGRQHEIAAVSGPLQTICETVKIPCLPSAPQALYWYETGWSWGLLAFIVFKLIATCWSGHCTLPHYHEALCAINYLEVSHLHFPQRLPRLAEWKKYCWLACFCSLFYLLLLFHSTGPLPNDPQEGYVDILSGSISPLQACSFFISFFSTRGNSLDTSSASQRPVRWASFISRHMPFYGLGGFFLPTRTQYRCRGTFSHHFILFVKSLVWLP